MRRAVVLQARTGSTRLPGKALADLGGRRLIEAVMGRFEGLEIEKILAIPEGPKDDILAGIAEDNSWEVFRGPEEDVLSRYALCVERFELDLVLRATGDNPLVDPVCCDMVLDLLMEYDCVRTAGWPGGTAVEGARGESLLRASAEAVSPKEREHVMPFLYRRPDIFRVGRADAPADRSAPDLRLTVDEDRDLELVRRIIGELGSSPPLPDVISLLRNRPDLVSINSDVRQKGVDE